MTSSSLPVDVAIGGDPFAGRIEHDHVDEPLEPSQLIEPAPATGRTNTVPALVPVASERPFGEAARVETCTPERAGRRPGRRAARARPRRLPSVKRRRSTCRSGRSHIPGWSAATRRIEGQRPVAGQNVTPFNLRRRANVLSVRTRSPSWPSSSRRDRGPSVRRPAVPSNPTSAVLAARYPPPSNVP